MTTLQNDSHVTSPALELSAYCPYLTCGERTLAREGFCICGRCGNAFNICPSCRSTNRLLAVICRGCGQRVPTQSWPMETGLWWNPVPRTSLTSLAPTGPHFPVNLGVGVQVSPIASDGLIVICQTDGVVVVVSEHTAYRLLEFSVGSQISVTPALQNGMLFVATASDLYAFDLATALDQPSLKQARPVWKFSCGAEIISQPLLVDRNCIYVLTRNSLQTVLYAISQEDGTEEWSTPNVFGLAQHGYLVMVQGELVLVSQGVVNVIDAITGEITQTFTLNRHVDPEVAPFVVRNRVLLSDPLGCVFEIVLDPSGPLINPLHDVGSRISTISASNEYVALTHLAGVTLLSSRGAHLWTSQTIESVSTVPIIAAESLFVLDDGGNGLLFDMLKANPVQRVRLLPGEVGMSPLMTRSHIVVVGADGKVVAVEWR